MSTALTRLSMTKQSTCSASNPNTFVSVSETERFELFNKEEIILFLLEENRYFRTYNTFNSIKHAVDMSLIQYISGVPLTDARRVTLNERVILWEIPFKL